MMKGELEKSGNVLCCMILSLRACTSIDDNAVNDKNAKKVDKS